MQIGIFAKTFRRNNYSEVFEAVSSCGYTTLQFNMTCAGLSSMPETFPAGLAAQIKESLQCSNLSMAALSGTFNMIHPDQAIREKGRRSIKQLIGNCQAMGTNVVTICTGTRNSSYMWTRHPDNTKPEAWKDLCFILAKVLAEAEKEGVIIAFEPELANVINSAKKGRQLLDEMKSANLKVVFDPANLFEKGTKREIEKILAEGLELLGEDIIIVHAKDRLADGTFVPAGQGVIPYPFFIRELKKTGFNGPLITHKLEEEQAESCCRFLVKLLSA